MAARNAVGLLMFDRKSGEMNATVIMKRISHSLMDLIALYDRD